MSDIYWLNKDSRTFLERGYLKPGVSPEQRIREISEHAEQILKIEGFADKFQSYLHKGWYSLSSPIWSNFGAGRGLSISCNGSFVPDDTAKIFDKISEIAIMSKYGAGTSAYFGDIRPRGAPIRDGGKTDGSVSFMRLFDLTASVISQGNTRRGSFAAYLPIDHGDIEDFLQIRGDGNLIQDMNFGVCVPDYWMREMIDGDAKKRDIWGKVIKKRFETGYPYIFFTDTINNNAPQVYKDKGLKIVASNLCVAGDQLVVTSNGLETAHNLYKSQEPLVLFDGKKRVNASRMELVEKMAKVYRVTLSNGMTHDITSYHKIKTKDGDKSCDELKIGDSVSIQLDKGLFGSIDMPDEAFLLGLYQGDGTQTSKNVMIDIWENDFDLIPEIKEKFDSVYEKYKCGEVNNRIYNSPSFISQDTGVSTVKKERLASPCLKKALGFKKGEIPSWILRGNEETQWQYIRGLFYTDGTVFVSYSSGNPLQLSLASVDKPFLQKVQVLLANLGIKTSIRILRKGGVNSLPDGKGGEKDYLCSDCFRLIIGNKNDALIFNQKTEFLDRKNISIENRLYRDNTKKYQKVVSVEYLNNQDVYCCKVDSNEHHWVCNGVITHNCSEICLPASEHESFVCDLSSMNLLHYDDWKDTDAVEILTYFLDAVMSDYIAKTKNIPHMRAAYNFAVNHRAIGVGVLGWHSLLQSRMIAFESLEAKLLNTQIHRLIRDKSQRASMEMAEKYGEPPLLKGYGMRNTTTMAIAPTTSSAFILGQVSPSIEPLPDNYHVKDLAKGTFSYKNPYLKKLLESKDKDSAAVWKSILEKGGSVQHLSFLDDNEKAVFKTFDEISPKEILIQAAARQKYIDQSQSLNLRISKTTSPKDMNNLLIFAWQNGIKTIYYQRGTNAAQQLVRDINTCSSCES